VNVEANPDLMDEFYHHRPDDKNINIGVSPKSGEMEFYLFMDGNGLNTFSASERDKTIGSGNQLKEIRMIQTITLNEVIEAYCNGEWPNLLSIDCEGLDYDILCTAKIENGPDVICVETRRHDTQKMKAIVQSHGYKLVTRLAENLIFVRNDQFEKGY
jgi:FkbM family methyltransferase